MTKRMGRLGVFASVVLLGSVAMADVRYLDHTRGVAASGTVWPVLSQSQGQNDARSSIADGVFDDTAKVTVNVVEQVPVGDGLTRPNSVTAFAEAWQQSVLTPTTIMSNGRLDYYTSESYLGNGVANASSSLSVRFALDTPHAYQIYFIGGVPGEIAKLVCEGTGQTYDFSESRGGEGLLNPGIYTLDHSISYGATYHGGSLPVDFGMVADFSAASPSAVPEPASVGVVMAAVAVLGLRRKR